MLHPTNEVVDKKNHSHAQSSITEGFGNQYKMPKERPKRAKQGVSVELHFGGINFKD